MEFLNGKRILISGKGGSGKSTVTTLLANVMNQKGYKVTLLDSDPSNPGGLTRLCLGMKNGPNPLSEFFKVKSVIHGKNNEKGIANQNVRLKIADIPPRYYVNDENKWLFQIGKIPQNEFDRNIFSEIANSFHIEDTVTLIDTKAGIEDLKPGIDMNHDVIFIVVSPEYESIRIAERIFTIAKDRGIKHVWAILNNVETENVEKEVKSQLFTRGVDVIGTIEHDSDVKKASLTGEEIKDCSAFRSAYNIVFQTGNMMLTRSFQTIYKE